jgi:alkanesulfonate monooxygenase SsuD/methylene tetrahydromethanopterin reductase-like flavin-dependent oxidoreductase (luciferase family)
MIEFPMADLLAFDKSGIRLEEAKETTTWSDHAGSSSRMSAGRRTPVESVGALSEAIDIIRRIWDVSAPGGVRVDGEHYLVRGAMRGPQPAHDILIWVPAGGPRMLRLVGRKAGGWITGGD